MRKSQRSRFQWDTQNPKTEQLEAWNSRVLGSKGKTSYKCWPKFLLWKCQCINFGDLIQQMGWGMGWLWRKHNFRGVVGSPKVVCFTQSSEKHKIMIPQSYCQQWLVNIQNEIELQWFETHRCSLFLLSFWTKMYHHGSVSQKDCLSFFHRNHVSGLRKIWCFFNSGLWRIFWETSKLIFWKLCVRDMIYLYQLMKKTEDVESFRV